MVSIPLKKNTLCYTLLLRHGAARDPASHLVRAPSRVLRREVLTRQPQLQPDAQLGEKSLIYLVDHGSIPPKAVTDYPFGNSRRCWTSHLCRDQNFVSLPIATKKHEKWFASASPVVTALCWNILLLVIPSPLETPRPLVSSVQVE